MQVNDMGCLLDNHHYQSYSTKEERNQPKYKARLKREKKGEKKTSQRCREKEKQKTISLSRALGELDTKNEVAVTDCKKIFVSPWTDRH